VNHEALKSVLLKNQVFFLRCPLWNGSFCALLLLSDCRSSFTNWGLPMVMT